MMKGIRPIINTLLAMIKAFLSWMKRYVVLIQLLVAICCVVFCLNLLYIWYRVPYKSVTYTTKTYGCAGVPKCKILAMMDYGKGETNEDQAGFYVFIHHPVMDVSPYLFKENVLGTNVARTDCYMDEYKPLCYACSSAIDSISTLYKSIITLESNLYDVVRPIDTERWHNKKEVVIWQRPTTVNNSTVSESEDWFYVKHKTHNSLGDTIVLGHKLLTGYDNFFPKWSSKGDVSKLKFRLNVKNYDLIECEEIAIHFNGAYALGSISLEPDEKGYGYISYTDPFKLKVICKDGLDVYSSFPELERMQQTRIAILMIIIPILLSWLLYILRKTFFVLRKSKGIR